MRVRKLSPTGDFTFGNGVDNYLINTPEAVAQVVTTSLKLWLGEWFFDTSLGVPYLQGIIGKYSQQTADMNLKAYIIGIQGVADILEFVSTLDPDTRMYSVVKCEINTIYGPSSVQILNYQIY